ncbi:MAG TPA: hypothetical protein VJ600_02440 [Holophagaceae bacterium]|nr:hypothetical protein [Holophagaceae bacterium]
MERLSKFAAALPVLPLALLLACAGGGSPQSSTTTSTSQSQAVSLSPDVNRITMTEQHNRQFKAVVNGTADQAVTWKVLESDGGTIDAAGNYTAPSQEGTYHIQVTSAANPAVSSTIETTVVPPATIGTFVPSKGYTTSGGAVTLTASWSGGTASIDHGVGALATSPATPTVNPTASTVYNLTVINSAGDPTIQSVFVKVDGTISVYVTPTAVRLGIRQSYAFVAVVTGATDNRVTWSVEEGAAGGTINYAGAYTAPANAAGVFHVRATSVEDPTKYSRSTVTVTYGWSSPSILDQGLGSDGNAPALAGDPTSGNAFAVWMEKDSVSGNTVPWAARFTATTGTWGDFKAISDGYADGSCGSTAGYDLKPPAIAMDASGNAMAVWMQTTAAAPSRFDVFAAYYQAGLGWKARVLISDGLNTVLSYPKVVLDGSGNAIAVWGETDGTRTHIWANRFTGGAWGTATQLESNANGPADPPYLAGDSSGNAIATWAQSDGTAASAYAVRYAAGSGWEAPVLLETDTGAVNANGYKTTVRIAMNASGKAVAAWDQYNGTTNITHALLYTPGTGWAGGVTITAGTPVTLPNVAIDTAGNYVVTCFYNNTLLCYRSVDGSLTNAGTGSTPYVSGEAAAVAMDASGDVVVSWIDTDITTWVNSSLANGAWRTPIHIQNLGTSGTSFFGGDLSVFLDAMGRGVITYPSQPGPQDVITWSRLQ